MVNNRIKTALLTVLALISVESISAQSIDDAYRFSQQYREGTARTMAMGNAFTALGGDLGSIGINPAAAGVYRYSEISLTPSITIGGNDVNYLNNNSADSKTRFGISSFGYVNTNKTGRRNSGLINWNIGLAINKTNNFTSRMSAYGEEANSSWLSSLAQSTNGIHNSYLDMTDDYDPFYEPGVPWKSILAWNTTLLDPLPDSDTEYLAATENILGNNIVIGGPLEQNYNKEVVGSITEATVSFSGNISNKLFFGASMGIQTIVYKSSENYSERAVNPSQFETGFNNFTHIYNMTTSGTGVNFKAGVIYVPVKGLRLGASISTPTWMYLKDEWQEGMISNFNETATSDKYNQKISAPLGVFEYNLKTPFRFNTGIAYSFKNIGVISAEYEIVDYSQMKYTDPNNSSTFIHENSDIIETFERSNIFKFGAEINLTSQFALRGGYQYYSSGEKATLNYNKPAAIELVSGGLGYTFNSGVFIDVAYQQQVNSETKSFWLYDDIVSGDEVISAAPEGLITPNLSKFILTLGFKF